MRVWNKQIRESGNSAPGHPESGKDQRDRRLDRENQGV